MRSNNTEPCPPIDDTAARTRVEAAAFRRLIAHLQSRTDVQNIDVMELAGFCRNCLSKWYAEAATGEGHNLAFEDVRTWVYGMPYGQWKSEFQT